MKFPNAYFSLDSTLIHTHQCSMARLEKTHWIAFERKQLGGSKRVALISPTGRIALNISGP
jgi:hypothetical protein